VLKSTRSEKRRINDPFSYISISDFNLNSNHFLNIIDVWIFFNKLIADYFLSETTKQYNGF